MERTAVTVGFKPTLRFLIGLSLGPIIIFLFPNDDN